VRSPAAYVVEAIVASLDTRLPSLEPDSARKLKELFERVAHASSMNPIDVSEIAQSCHIVVQQALTALLSHLNVPENERPSGTRDRVRLLVRRAPVIPSETERKLIEGLVDYVLGWFGPLGEYVHKYRHPIGFTADKAHASRCLIYTYLLLHDLLDLTGY